MIRNIILFIFLSCSFCFGQRIKTTFIDTKPMKAYIYYGFDGFGNHYFSNKNVLIKSGENQNWEYKNIGLGDITSVDIINPLYILVFYEQFNTIVALDNQLNEIKKIDLSIIKNDLVANKIGLSGKNSLWLFNVVNQRLSLYDSNTKNLINLSVPLENAIKYSTSDFNYFYWIDDMNKLFSCTIFGRISFLVNIPSFEKIQIIDGEKILLINNNQLYFLNIKGKTVIQVEIDEKTIENFYYKDQILAIFTNQQIKKYKIKLP